MSKANTPTPKDTPKGKLEEILECSLKGCADEVWSKDALDEAKVLRALNEFFEGAIPEKIGIGGKSISAIEIARTAGWNDCIDEQRKRMEL